MTKDEFKDRLFDVLNETDALAIQDISADDSRDLLDVCLEDGSSFFIHVE